MVSRARLNWTELQFGQQTHSKQQTVCIVGSKYALNNHSTGTIMKIHRPDWITEIPHKLNFFSYDYPFESKASVLANEITWE